MRISFDDDGRVIGGIECQLEGEDQTENVCDLQKWLRNQFLKLKSEHKKGFHAIWLGDGEGHFASIETTSTKYRVLWAHEESGKRVWEKGMDTFAGSTNLAKICDEIATQASLVNDLRWTHASSRKSLGINIRYPRRLASPTA